MDIGSPVDLGTGCDGQSKHKPLRGHKVDPKLPEITFRWKRQVLLFEILPLSGTPGYLNRYQHAYNVHLPIVSEYQALNAAIPSLLIEELQFFLGIADLQEDVRH
ncbi:hypothetical protein Tco_0530577 [Tanacetum coccineum]